MISIKRLATLGAAGGLLLASAMPVLAGGPHHGGFGNVIKNFNGGAVINNVATMANTGGNSIGANGGNVGNSGIGTGNAVAVSEVTTVLNSNVNDPCGCRGNLTINRNRGFVANNVMTAANTGGNDITASGHGHGHHGHGGGNVNGSGIVTGNAVAGSVVTSVVNTNMNF